MYSEVAWVLVSSEIQFRPQIILYPDYVPDYLSVSCDYDYKLLCMDREYINTGLINIRN